jgi:polar amino acid transport system substrate-binding protein
MKSAFKMLHFFFIVSVLCNGCTKQKQQPQGLTLEDGVLSVGVEVGYPPMEYLDVDGKTLIGFDIEMTTVLAEKLGLKVKFIDTAWEGIMAGLDVDKYDIAINITILPERQERYNFTIPYIDSSITIVVLKGSPLKIAKPEDIEGFSVAYQSDTTAQYFTEKLRKRRVKFAPFSYDKILNCFDDLRMGRVDLVVVDNIVAYDYAGKENSPFEVAWQGHSKEKDEKKEKDELIGICLKKGNNALTNALNNALDELFEDGTLLKISQNIFNRDLISSVR